MPSGSKSDVERFNSWAVTYERSWMQRWYFDPVHDAMLDLIARDAMMQDAPRILDVGCGTGRLLRAAARRWPRARLQGADPAPNMVEQARRLAPEADVRVAQAEELPFPDETVDIAFTSLSFHHWDDQQHGLGQIARVLVPGGRLCLADHVMPGARLIEPRSQSPAGIAKLVSGAGLTVTARQRLWARFVFITLAKKM